MRAIPVLAGFAALALLAACDAPQDGMPRAPARTAEPQTWYSYERPPRCVPLQQAPHVCTWTLAPQHSLAVLSQGRVLERPATALSRQPRFRDRWRQATGADLPAGRRSGRVRWWKRKSPVAGCSSRPCGPRPPGKSRIRHPLVCGTATRCRPDRPTIPAAPTAWHVSFWSPVPTRCTALRSLSASGARRAPRPWPSSSELPRI